MEDAQALANVEVAPISLNAIGAIATLHIGDLGSSFYRNTYSVWIVS